MSFAIGTPLNQQNIGTTIRPSSTALLTIDSEDRFTDFEKKRAARPGSYNYSPYNFNITKNQAIMNGFFTRLAVTEIVFPWAIPNINIRTASIRIFWKIGAADTQSYLLTPDSEFQEGTLVGEPYLPIGFYTPAQLAARLQLALEEITGFSALTVKYGYDEITYSSAIKANPSNLPIFAVYTGDSTTPHLISFLPLDANTSEYPYPSSTRQLFDLLGFDSTAELLSDIIIGNPTYCQAIKYVDIVCPTLVYNQALKDTSSAQHSEDSLCRIYLANADNSTNQLLTSSDISGSGSQFCPPGCAPTTLYRQFNVPKYINWIPNQPVSGQLVFRVLDDQGQVLDPQLLVDVNVTSSTRYPSLPLDWQMTMLVSEN